MATSVAGYSSVETFVVRTLHTDNSNNDNVIITDKIEEPESINLAISTTIVTSLRCVLDRHDTRLRSIPFNISRATLEQSLQAYRQFYTVYVERMV